MFGIGKLLSKEQRFKLIKNKTIQKLVVWKNRNKHPNPAYSLILFSRMFDVDWYLTEYPDVAMAKLDPILHYIEHGVHQKRNPNPWFNTKEYEEKNRLPESGNAFLHFLLNGKNPGYIDSYKKWREIYFPLDEDRISEIQKELVEMEDKVLISIVIMVSNPNLDHLKKAIESINHQVYTDWELCIADNASDNQKVINYLRELEEEHEKAKVVFHQEKMHLSEICDSVIELSSGKYLALLYQDDLLSLDALYEIAKAINDKANLGLIYSDEDKIDENGELFDPHFKSDWNPMLFYSHNYLNHFFVVKKSLCQQVNTDKKSYNASQGYNYILRCLEHMKEDEIHHIPKILYHWRSVEMSMKTDTESQTEALEEGRKALEVHLQKRFSGVEVAISNNVFYKLNFPIAENPALVSVIIPFGDNVQLLSKCVESFFKKTTYPNFEIISIGSNSSQEEGEVYPESLEKHSKVKILQLDRECSRSEAINFAADQANGKVILMLDPNVEFITDNWLTEMISYFAMEEVATVGAKLLFEDDTISHAGMVLGIGGVAGNPHRNLPSNAMGYMYRANLVQNVSAVSWACMAVRKSVFDSVGGLDVKLETAFFDVDLCIKIREKGYKIVYTPYAQLYHFEKKSKQNPHDPKSQQMLHSEIRYMQNKWRGILYCDPYYNPNLSLEAENFQLAFPPAHIYGNLRDV